MNQQRECKQTLVESGEAPFGSPSGIRSGYKCRKRGEIGSTTDSSCASYSHFTPKMIPPLFVDKASE